MNASESMTLQDIVPKDVMICISGNYLNLCSINNLLKTCKVLNSIAIDDVLSAYPRMCNNFTQYEHLNTLVRHAQCSNKTMFLNVIKNENDECTKSRKNILDLLHYTIDANYGTLFCSLDQNISAYRAIAAEKKDININTFFNAISNNHYYFVILFIKNDVEINSVDQYDGYMPLHKASLYGCTKIAQLLINYGAEINATDDSGCTALHCASKNERTDTVTLLIDNGANVNATDKYGSPPLHYALHNKQTDIINMLINRGTDINAKDTYGWTALFYASRNGYTHMAALLINNDADINATDNDGLTPLYYASKDGHAAIVKLLENTQEKQK